MCVTQDQGSYLFWLVLMFSPPKTLVWWRWMSVSLGYTFLKQCPFLTLVYPPSSSPPALCLFMLLLALHTLHPYCHNTSWGQEGYSGKEREILTGINRQESWEMEVERNRNDYSEEEVDREQWGWLMFSIIFSEVTHVKAICPPATEHHSTVCHHTNSHTWEPEAGGFVRCWWFVNAPDYLFY